MPIGQNESPHNASKPGRGGTRLLQTPGSRSYRAQPGSRSCARTRHRKPPGQVLSRRHSGANPDQTQPHAKPRQQRPRKWRSNRPRTRERERLFSGHRHRVRHTARSFVCARPSAAIRRSRAGREQRRLASRRSFRGRGSISSGSDRGGRPFPKTCSQLDCEIMTASSQPSSQPSFQPSIEEQGATLSALQPMYSALVREFVIEVSACPVDEEFSSSPESIEHAEAWFQQVDAEIQVHQLRQFLQTTPLANEGVLRHLLLHHMHKAAKSTSDRDKTDFLLVQYFSLCAPSGLEDTDLDLDYVAQVLEPVLGPQEPKLPAWLASLETIMQSAARCRRLSELLHSGALEQGRKLKTQNS